jgi:GT2 family glycosyltransferase
MKTTALEGDAFSAPLPSPGAVSQPPFVCSVVLTHDNYFDTNECLESLVKQTYERHQVIVVDNGSTDGSAERLMDTWGGQVQLIRSATNLGCGGGYNIGLQAALAAGADYAMIVDNDVVVLPGLIESLVEACSHHAEAAGAAPIIVQDARPGRVWFAGGRYSRLLGYTRHPGLNGPVSRLGEKLGKVYPCDYAPTCVLLMSRQALKDVGLMDERCFFGHDDVDWWLRAATKGYVCLVVGEPLARHKISVSGGVRGSSVMAPFSAYYHARESILIGVKHHRGLAFPPFMAGQLFVRLPYYCLSMVLAGRWRGALAYVRGISAGAWRYLLRGSHDWSAPEPMTNWGRRAGTRR